jgi:hypothetical protein
MMRRSALDRVGGYRAEFNIVEDLDLFLRLAEVGRLANLPDRLLRYRQHLKSVVKRHFDKQISMREKVIRLAYERRGMPAPEPLGLCERVLFAPDEQTRRWGWHALKHKNVAAARAHAKHLIKLRPLMPEAWKLFYCSLRGY